MSPYLLVGVAVALLAFAGSNAKWEKISYCISLALLTMFLALRFGQGTDWLAYNYLFEGAPSTIDFDDIYYTDAFHSEFGWKLINNVVKATGLDFVFVSVASSLLEMGMLARFVNRYSPNRALSLLIAFPVVYLTYFFSALRQGIVIAVFLGLMLPWLQSKKYVRYMVFIALASLIHSLALVLVMPLLLSRFGFRSMGVVLGVSAIIGVALTPALPSVISAADLDYSGNTISIVAVLYRVIVASLVYFLYKTADPENVGNEIKFLIKVYICGLATYALLMGNDIIASRLASPLLAIEIVLVPMLVKRAKGRSAVMLILCLVLLVSVMSVKNIDSYIDQGSYSPSVSVLSYPYISVFNMGDIYEVCSSRYLLYLR